MASILRLGGRTGLRIPASSKIPLVATRFSLSIRYMSTENATEDYGKTFDKILIANRGEIACRVIRTCKKMGIKTVAVYSDPDANSLHVRLADEAVNIGPAASKDSYLNIDNIIKAIKQTGAQAVHPGYGFLSENFHFGERLQENGVTFIGPNFQAIHAMGDKIESKILALKAKVNTIPGFNGVVDSVDHAIQIAHEIGYPVMIKASAGGGGKGMRIAWKDDEVKEAYTLSKNEAASSFGDDRLLVEKFIDNPRHIEIQVLGDKHGNTVYLNERECSIQRRNQKVIEEAPSTHIDPKTRKAMGEQAVALAKAVGYDSAGTCEFLVDSQKNFYFLEMNTRLQVEHPITELITGVDLVEQMIRVAAGQKLKLAQKDITINGWAFESRVYAEDPKKYLPSIGTLTTYIEPESLESDEESQAVIRCDSGIVEGSEISMYYDPLICKLITHGKDRKTALKLMLGALDSYVIKGVTHNIPLLYDVYSHERFRKGEITTKFLQEEYPEGFDSVKLDSEGELEVLAMAAYVYGRTQMRNYTYMSSEIHLSSGLHNRTAFKAMIKLNGIYREIGIEFDDEDKATIYYGDSSYTLETPEWSLSSPILFIELDGHPVVSQVHDNMGDSMRLIYKGSPIDIEILTDAQYELIQHMPEKTVIDTSLMILSPMPGSVIAVNVKEGDKVLPNGEVATVEAMKMQNVLRSVSGGVVKKVHVKVGQSVAADEIMIEFEKSEN